MQKYARLIAVRFGRFCRILGKGAWVRAFLNKRRVFFILAFYLVFGYPVDAFWAR